MQFRLVNSYEPHDVFDGFELTDFESLTAAALAALAELGWELHDYFPEDESAPEVAPTLVDSMREVFCHGTQDCQRSVDYEGISDNQITATIQAFEGIRDDLDEQQRREARCPHCADGTRRYRMTDGTHWHADPDSRVSHRCTAEPAEATP